MSVDKPASMYQLAAGARFRFWYAEGKTGPYTYRKISDRYAACVEDGRVYANCLSHENAGAIPVVYIPENQ